MSNIIEAPPSCNVYTPPALAAAIVHILGDNHPAEWLEPCVGKGAFLVAMSSHGVPEKHIVGIDLCHTSEPTDSLATVQRGIEFLKWANGSPQRVNRVVANPPYIALSKLPRAIQVAAQMTLAPDGTRIGKGANCWYAFLCASLRLLRKGGSIGFVLPAAFEYANYAKQLRAALPTLFGKVDVHRCRSTLFGPIGDGSVVLIGRGYGLPRQWSRRFEYATLDELVVGLSRKRVTVNRTSLRQSPRPHKSHLYVNDVMVVGLGAVTGDASYFLMTEKERRDQKLPVAACRPVLSKAKHVNSPLATSEYWARLRSDGERVWLFRPTGEVVSHPAVQRYLKLSPQNGGCRRSAYKVANREPWYVTPLPLSPDGFISGMSQHGPILCVNKMRWLSATNTLYWVRFRKRLSLRARFAWALMLLSSTVRQQLNAVGRDYALGLRKLEPCDLKALSIPVPRVDSRASRDYRRAVGLLLEGNDEDARRIADSHVLEP